MAISKVTYNNFDFQFSDDDIVNPDDFVPTGEYDPHNVHPFLLHDEGFPVAVVFADNLQDALDIACDEGKLDQFKVDLQCEGERDDYLTDDFASADCGLDSKCPEYISPDGRTFWWRDGMTPTFLGNAGEPFDIENIGVVELRNPPFSFCALLNCATDETRTAVSGFPE